MSCFRQRRGGGDGLYPCSRDGLQGQVLGTEAAGVQTDSQYQVAIEAVLPPDGQCGVHVVDHGCISFLVQLSVFPGLDGCLSFLFALFSRY